MKETTNIYISQNPFRIIGVLSNSGIKEIHKNLSKLKAYSKLDKKVDLDYDLNFLNLAELVRDNDTITKVESRILLDENKVKYSLFWFSDVTSYDSIALANLAKGNKEKALDIWQKAIKSDELSSNNYSAFNNISTLLMFLSLDESKSDLFSNSSDSIYNLKQAINYKYSLISSDFLKNFYNDIGVTSSISISEIQSFFATTILEILNNNFSTKELVNFVDGLDESFASIINSNLVKSPISNIKINIKEASKNLTENEKDGIFIGKKLIKDSNKDLMYLRETLGATNYQYEDIADKLSNQILQCGILCFNATGDDQAYLSSYKYALSIAISEKTRLRAEDSIKHCNEEKSAKVCKLCNVNEISNSEGLRIEMFKMTSYNKYSYFKDGGLELKCCSSCKSKNLTNKYTAFFVALITYGIASFISYGVLVGLDLLSKFTILPWWFKYIKTKMYYDKLNHHPLLRSSLLEGYEYGMPSNN